MEIINLNQVRKITVGKRQKSEFYKWFTEKKRVSGFWTLFLPKNRRRYVDNTYISYDDFGEECYENVDEFNEKNKDDGYYCDPWSKIIFRKAYVELVFIDGAHNTRWFDSNNDAEDFFNKLKTYAHDNNVPFIDFNAE